MATIYNSELMKELANAARLQQSRDKIPDQITDKVMPVMEVNPRLLKFSEICKYNTAINALEVTIYQVPTYAEFYLTSVFISVIKDATATSLYSRVRITINGVSCYLCQIPGITLTAQNQSATISFPFPIKCDKGTLIVLQNSTNVGNVSSVGMITGYEVYNNTA